MTYYCLSFAHGIQIIKQIFSKLLNKFYLDLSDYAFWQIFKGPLSSLQPTSIPERPLTASVCPERRSLLLLISSLF